MTEDLGTGPNGRIYYALIICGDYEGNVEDIAKVLNGFVFEQPDEQGQIFVVFNGRIEYREDCATSAGYVECDERAFVSLSELSKAISPLLTRGTLELVVIEHRIAGTIFLNTLAIYSDGRVESQRQEFDSVDSGRWQRCLTWEFDPKEEQEGNENGTCYIYEKRSLHVG
jgi:hypothetical protein